MPKRTLETRLQQCLTGETLHNSLNFVAYLKETGMTTTTETSGYFTYMGELICIIIEFEVSDEHPEGMWIICDCQATQHDVLPLDEKLKEFLHANVSICTGECGCKDWPRGGDKIIFGQEFKSVCSSEIKYINPSSGELEKVKMLMELWKHAIADKAHSQ